jgi:hypothetical protein
MPGRHPKFDSSGSVPSHCQRVALRTRASGGLLSTAQMYCLGLVFLTLGHDQAPLRGQRPVKPPALPEDTYLRKNDRLGEGLLDIC